MDETMKELFLDALTYETVITILITFLIIAPRLEAIFHGFMIGCIAKLLI